MSQLSPRPVSGPSQAHREAVFTDHIIAILIDQY